MSIKQAPFLSFSVRHQKKTLWRRARHQALRKSKNGILITQIVQRKQKRIQNHKKKPTLHAPPPPSTRTATEIRFQGLWFVLNDESQTYACSSFSIISSVAAPHTHTHNRHGGTRASSVRPRSVPCIMVAAHGVLIHGLHTNASISHHHAIRTDSASHHARTQTQASKHKQSRAAD